MKRKQVVAPPRVRAIVVFPLRRTEEEEPVKRRRSRRAFRVDSSSRIPRPKRRGESIDVVGDDRWNRFCGHDGIKGLNSEGIRLADEFEDPALGGRGSATWKLSGRQEEGRDPLSQFLRSTCSSVNFDSLATLA